jgi:hypothetical protein
MSASVRWLACLFTLAGLVIVFPTITDAGKKQKETQEEIERKNRDHYMDDLAMAYRLKELADDDKNESTKASSLLAAATTFRRLAGVPLDTIDEKPVIENVKGEKATELVDKAVGKPDLVILSDKLLDQVGVLSAKKQLKLEKVVDDVRNCKFREAFGGPKHVSRLIGGQQHQTFHVDVVPLRPMHFTFHASIPMRVTIVRADNDNPYDGGIAARANTTYHPGPSRTGKVPITIRVSNLSNQPGSYQLYVN